MNLDTHYRLSHQVAIRPERFGGLVYRYDNRRLYFLHSHELVQFVSELNGERPLGEALDDFLRSRALAESARETFLKAVAQLDTMGLLDRS